MKAARNSRSPNSKTTYRAFPTDNQGLPVFRLKLGAGSMSSWIAKLYSVILFKTKPSHEFGDTNRVHRRNALEEELDPGWYRAFSRGQDVRTFRWVAQNLLSSDLRWLKVLVI